MTDYPGSPCRSCDGPDRGSIPPVPGLYEHHPAIRSRRVINRLEIAIRRHPHRSSPHAAVSLRHAASFSTEKLARRNDHAADLSAACVRPPCTAPGRYRILEAFASSSRRSSPPSPASHIGRGAFSRPPPARRGATGSICRTCNTR